MADDFDPPRPRHGRPPSPDVAAVLRTCQRHGETYHVPSVNRGRPRFRCRRCSAEAVTRRHRRIRALLLEEFGGECSVCGYSRCELNLHFHHVDPATKSFNMSVARGKSLAAYREEARKCVLVCANCHGEIESGLIESPPPLSGD